jgi:hypothetical protein
MAKSVPFIVVIHKGAICACPDGAKPVKKSMVQNLTWEMSFATIIV